MEDGTASQAPWEGFPAQWRDWSQSLPASGFVTPMAALLIGLRGRTRSVTYMVAQRQKKVRI